MAIAGNIALDQEVYIRVTEWEDGTKNLLQNERTRKVHFFLHLFKWNYGCSKHTGNVRPLSGTTDVQNLKNILRIQTWCS